MKPGRRNLPASAARRLLDYARRHGQDYQHVLTQYGLERLLYRLSRTPHSRQFVVKGAFLFLIWSGERYRSTRDLDLTTSGQLSMPEAEAVFRAACHAEVPGDGLVFETDPVRAEEIREDNAYGGVRVNLSARLGRVEIPVQVDIGFGDAITPAASEVDFPVLLEENPAPRLLACPRETVVAEKLETIVRLGMANSRMKDYYDVWILLREFAFDGDTLRRAIDATFHRRRSTVPADVPLGLGDEFAQSREKNAQWHGFLNRMRPHIAATGLAETVAAVRAFVMEPMAAARPYVTFPKQWPPGGPWR